MIAQSTADDHFIRINAAKGVLLACGGYAGNPYMMEQLDPLGTSVTTACSYTPADKGYGIRAAIWQVHIWMQSPLPFCSTVVWWHPAWMRLCGQRERLWRQGLPRHCVSTTPAASRS